MSILVLSQSGAKINISDGSSPERIVTVTGCTESILKAFSLVAQKFEDVSNFMHLFLFLLSFVI